MIEGVDTGYEGKFDFPQRALPPETTYMLATVPRTGSTFLGHLLWRTGCLGAPLEYLNFEPAGPYGFASRSTELQQRLWQSVLRRRTSPNGVFGLKCFPTQLQALDEGNPPLLAAVMAALVPPARPARIVYLGRRDRSAHVASYARATLSGVWREEQEAGRSGELDYSERALDRAGQWIDGQAAGWEQMFHDLGIAPLRIWYEDVVAAPEAAVAAIARYLGVAVDPSAAVAVPEVVRQSASETRAWAALYAEAKQG